MSLEPKTKRRKMEPSIGRDDNVAESSTSSAVHTSKTILKAPTGSPSGDFGNAVAHQYLTYVSVAASDRICLRDARTFEEYRQPCELGDSWCYKYPLPLSKYPALPVRTGNLFYDGAIADLEHMGFKPLQVVAKARSGTIVLAQNLHKAKQYPDCEIAPVALKLNSGNVRRNRLVAKSEVAFGHVVAKARSGTIVLAQNLHKAKQYPDCEITPVALKLNSGNVRRNRLVAKSEVTDEMNIHKHLHHVNVVAWISNVSVKGRFGIVMEFCENGTLEQLIKIQDGRFLTEAVSRRYYRQIHSAVDYLHGLGFAHRDICLQNVLLTASNVPKLSDFGHAVPFPGTADDHMCTDECGSLGYQAPEILLRQPYNPRLSDIWSLGALLYYMCIGRLPLGVIKADILAKANKEIPFPDDKVMPLSVDLKDLLKSQLLFIPEHRYSMNRIAHHEWMTSHDERLQIGNFYKVRQPQKTNVGDIETKMKNVMFI